MSIKITSDIKSLYDSVNNIKILKVGHREWCELLSDETYNHEVIIMYLCGDIHPNKPHPKFPNAKTIFLFDCNKNFVYYWLRPVIFPLVKNIYLMSHPCESSVAPRFRNKNVTIYVQTERYEHYNDKFHKWFTDLDYVKPMDKNKSFEELGKIMCHL